MNDTLTDAQTPAAREAMAGATPDAAMAAPAATAATPHSATPVPPAPRKGGRQAAVVADAPLSTAPAADDAAPAAPAAPAGQGGPRWVGWLLTSVALVGVPLVGIIGFASSYSTLRAFAHRAGFTDAGMWSLAPWVPIGIDVSIVAFLAADLVMVRRRTPWPVLRLAAHGMTLVTVLLNALGSAWGTKGGKGWWDTLADDPMRALLHAALPVLFVIGVGAARRLLQEAAQIEEEQTDRIPLHRWVLSPLRTPRLYREMRLAGVRSYPEMIERKKDLTGYEVWLKQKCNGDLSQATETERLPMKMAPSGYTVEEALALPARWKAEADQRKAEEADQQAEREAEQAEREAERAAEQAERKAAADIKKLAAEARVKAAEHRIAAETGTAAADAEATTAEARARAESVKAKAEHTRRAAERQAETEAEALESEEAAAARRRAAEDNRKAAEAEADTAVALRKAETEKAEAERKKAERAQHEADFEKAEKEKAQAQRDKAVALADAARAREAAQRAEAAAQAAEDYADLNPRERKARRVARFLLAAHPDIAARSAADPVDPEEVDVETVPLAVIQEKLGASRTTAGEIRQEARKLICDGYRGTETTFESES
ncbi:DUF2637 domain-containing protein [Streptomyces sp. NPDC014646]|uniref:DUF2637 domain-containing protein n=1 Tax=Streptomyces sp. NPDC014646 TaxID=3364877 RepID=UPI0037025DED